VNLLFVLDTEGGKVGPAVLLGPSLPVDGQVQAGADGEVQRGGGPKEGRFLVRKPQQIIGVIFAV